MGEPRFQLQPLGLWDRPITDPRDAQVRTQTAVTVAYRRAARTMHPDAGGSADAFQLITTARDVLTRNTDSKPAGGES